MLDPAHPFYQGRLAQSQQDQQGRAEATVTLSELMERDSDLYHCYITHLQSEQGKGTGTTLIVMGREDRKESKQDTSTELTIYRATIALAGVSIIILVTALLLRRRTGIYSSFPAHSTCPFFRCSKCTSLPSYWCKGEREPPTYILQSSVQFLHLQSSLPTITQASFFPPQQPPQTPNSSSRQRGTAELVVTRARICTTPRSLSRLRLTQNTPPSGPSGSEKSDLTVKQREMQGTAGDPFITQPWRHLPELVLSEWAEPFASGQLLTDDRSDRCVRLWARGC
ncbi:uncharacterized protein ACDP82_015735 isoform 1-T1 [Pangshura tecta]